VKAQKRLTSTSAPRNAKTVERISASAIMPIRSNKAVDGAA